MLYNTWYNGIIHTGFWSLMRMNLSIFKKAFSLTELLIVLVIIAVLFAAMAPIISKRRSGETNANEQVWSFVNGDDQKNAFYDSGSRRLTSAAFMGLDPAELNGNYAPFAKVIIKARNNQNMIQFRTGEDNGVLSGLFFVDNNGNLLTTSRLTNNKDSNNAITNAKYNTVSGLGAVQKAVKPNGNTVLGANAVSGSEGDRDPQWLIAIGSNAGEFATGNSVLVGANTGRGSRNSNWISETIALGSGVLTNPDSGGKGNIFAGYMVGSVGFNDSNNSINNVIAGSKYYGLNSSNNTIMGYDVYAGGPPTAQNISAAGFGACDSIQPKELKGSRTCLGYKSAANRGPEGFVTPWSFEYDEYDHIFLGGSAAGFGGRSVLEVHNIPTSDQYTTSALPKMGPTVVLNSNLVVRGNTYFPLVDGRLSTHEIQPVINQHKFQKGEAGKDRCGKRCIAGRRKWRDSPKCKFLGSILGAIVGFIGGVITVVSSVLTAGVGGSIFIVVWGSLAGATIGTLFNGSDYTRPKDPPTFSVVTFGSKDDANKTLESPICADVNSTYPSGSYCPDLQLSDIRLKENLTLNNDSLKSIMFIKPYNYTFKSDDKSLPQVGVMAQDLQKYLPNSVTQGDDGYLSIRWDEMFYVTINSVKELDSIISNLVAELNAVEDDADDIKAEHKIVRNRIVDINNRIDKLEK